MLPTVLAFLQCQCTCIDHGGMILGARKFNYMPYGLVCAAGSGAGDKEDKAINMRAVLGELVAQDPRCYYRMVDAVIRRHASEQNLRALLADAVLFMHPSDAAGGSRKECSEPPAAAAALPCSDCTHDNEQNQLEAERHASATISSRSGADGLKLLGNWKQTQAFLSALLSYNKVLLTYRGSLPIFMFGIIGQGLSNVLACFGKEGVLDVLENAYLGRQGPESSSGGAASGGGGSGQFGSSSGPGGRAAAREVPSSKHAAGHSSSGTTGTPTCLPEELAACCMLALAVVARVAVTLRDMLEEPDPSRLRDDGSSNGEDPNGSSGSDGNSVASSAEDKTEMYAAWQNPGMMTAGLLGVVCYSLLKQLQQDGDTRANSHTREGSSGGTGGNVGVGGVPKAGAGTSRAEGNTAGKSRGNRGGDASSAPAAAASQNWGGLQLQLPAPLLQEVQEFEAKVQGSFGPEWAQVMQLCREGACLKGAEVRILKHSRGAGEPAHEHEQLEQVEKQEQQENVEQQEQQEGQEQEEPGEEEEEQPHSNAMVGLLQLVLGLCEEVMQQVQVPLGCNNPSCTNLEGLSEAAAAKVCTGCYRVHYCSPECLKEHWKEHKPFCKQK